MGHARSETFLRHYISSSVIVDVQATFLGRESKSDLIKEMGKLTLRRDPNLPKKLSEAQRKAAHQTPDIDKAIDELAITKQHLKQAFDQINKAPAGHPITLAHKRADQKVKTLKLQSERIAFEKLLTGFHTNADLEHMVRQLKGEMEVTVPMLAPVHHILPVRRSLAGFRIVYCSKR